MLASQLPEVLENNSAQNDALKTYIEQPQLEDTPSADGFRAVRTESAAYVVSSPGEIEAAEISIPWWDTEENRLKYAKLPAKKINVKGDATPIAQPGSQANQQNGSPAAALNTGEFNGTQNGSEQPWRTLTFCFCGTLGADTRGCNYRITCVTQPT